MKVICQGDNVYRIFDDTTQVYNLLPKQTYTVRFNKMAGFYLVKVDDLEINEKIYGVHEKKIKKVINAYDKFDRNLGVILSGDKGIGKTIFAKMLARDINLPVILVDTYYPGVASYIDEIKCEAMVLFDEFEKTFVENDDESSQTELLSLFDGTSMGKKLFVVTCNNLRQLNDYLINRPGRFHYHFMFEYPTPEEARQYLLDKVDMMYQSEIENVVEFSAMVDINYDSLRAIAFELNAGSTFKEALSDLNIINDDCFEYIIYAAFDNGIVLKGRDDLDLFYADNSIDDYESVGLQNDDCQQVADIYFKRGANKSIKGNVIDISVNDCEIRIRDKAYFSKLPKEIEALENAKLTRVYIKRNRVNIMRYAV